MSNALCIGDNCIDCYLSPKHERFFGGNALNTAVYLKLAGCDVSYMGAVGQDSDGKAILNALEARGIDVSHCQVYPVNTAYTKVQLDKEGNRIFLHEDRGATIKLCIDKEVLNYIHNFTVVHNTWLGSTEDYLKSFHNGKGNIVSMDFGERYTEDFIDKTIANVDIAFFSTNPGAQDHAESLARRMHQRGPQLVVVTMGNDGSIAFDGQQMFFQPAYKVEVVDTLGAGDTFIATS